MKPRRACASGQWRAQRIDQTKQMYDFYTKQWCKPSGYPTKFLLVMKITMILLLTAIVQVSATTYAQKITLSERNAPLVKVFKQIREQSGYDFAFTTTTLKGARQVTINVKNAEFKVVLDQIFEGQSLEYTLDNKTVIVSKKNTSLIETVKEKITGLFRQDSVTYRGTVYDETGQVLPGATITVKGVSRVVKTTPSGNFSIYGPREAILVVSYIGYGNREIKVKGENTMESLKITMRPASTDLSGVEVVSTGYQDLARERATGSFEVITAKQLTHSTDPSLLKRLEGITTSIDFRNDLRPVNGVFVRSPQNKSQLATMSIRGRNTLDPILGGSTNSGTPLVVIDGIASAYDIDMINPEDVESVTLLKDAASASIWGSRAANGVIVIKTKRGRLNSAARVSFNTNINVSDKIDYYYIKSMSVSDFIDAQRYAFEQQFPLSSYPAGSNPLGDIDVTQPQMFTSPVFEILSKERQTSDHAEANAQLDQLRKNDLRKDFNKYVLRNPFTQQYTLSVDAGTKSTAYRLSAGYSKSAQNIKDIDKNTFNLIYSTSVMVSKKLNLNATISYIQNNLNTPQPNTYVGSDYTQTPFLPYTRLVDDQGNPAVVPRDYRPGFLDALQSKYGSKTLDMSWKPLEDVKASYQHTKTHLLNLNTSADYKISSVFSINLNYSYNKSISNDKSVLSKDSYIMRARINQFTNPSTLNRAIPLGDLLTTTDVNSDLHTFRGLFNVNKNWNNKHEINAVAGVDVSQNTSTQKFNQLYGYNKDAYLINSLLDYKTNNTLLFNTQDGFPTARIPSATPTLRDVIARKYGIFANAAYTYNGRYTFSASTRRDASSEFGGNTNKKGSPYYSVGGAWNIAKEPFYNLSWLPVLSFRTTFGYNGNVNARYASDPTIAYSQSPALNGLLFVTPSAGNVTNANLRPEKTGMLNFGLNFGFKGDRITGSVEYYNKRTKDLIKTATVDPTLGYSQLTYNAGNLHGHGMDVTLNSINLRTTGFSWASTFLFSYSRVKLGKLFVPANNLANYALTSGGFVEGKDLDRIYAWKWAGLDPQTGDPRIFLNGQPYAISGFESESSKALNTELHYMGSAVPVYYGSFRNTFGYKNFSASFNLLYKLGYYSRRPTSDLALYGNLFGDFGLNTLQGAEIEHRWKNPGDEAFTNIPSMVYKPGPEGSGRDFFYQFADINVIKADHIRLQEINFAYVFNGKKIGFLKNPRLYANVTNLGIIWRANKLGIDPDIYDYPNPRQYSFGFSTNF